MTKASPAHPPAPLMHPCSPSLKSLSLLPLIETLCQCAGLQNHHLSFLAPRAAWHCPKHMALIAVLSFCFAFSCFSPHMCTFTRSKLPPPIRTCLNRNITRRRSRHGDVMDSHSACVRASWHVALIALFWSHCQPSSPSRLGGNVSLTASRLIYCFHCTSSPRPEESCMVFISRNTAKEQSFS